RQSRHSPPSTSSTPKRRALARLRCRSAHSCWPTGASAPRDMLQNRAPTLLYSRRGVPSSLGNDRLFIRLEVVERDAAAFGYTVERVIGEARLDPRAPEHQLGEVAQLAGAAGHHD